MVKNPSKWLLLFLLLQMTIWTLSPALDRHSLPHDMLEAITMGLQYQWGYNKHPFLSPWLTAYVSELCPATDGILYFLAQCAIAVAFYSVWQLAKLILPRWHALVATLLLVGGLFYNFHSINFTPDTLQTPLWAMLSLFCYKAFSTQTIKNWCWVGLVAGLCFLTKYQAIVIFLSILFFSFLNDEARQSYRKSGIYVGMGVFFIVISPHFLWLLHHHFITLDYATATPGRYVTAYGHLTQPLLLIFNSLVNMGWMLILLLPFLLFSDHLSNGARHRNLKYQQPVIVPTLFQWQFLLCLGFGPLCLSILLCAFFGNYFPSRWLTPYFTLWGVLAMVWLKPVLTPRKVQIFLAMVVLMSLLLSIAPFFPVKSKLRSDAYLPNPEIANALTTLWQQRYHANVPYIAGSRYLVASVIPYFKTKAPIPYFSWDHDISPWVNEEDLQRRGGLFIWDQGHNYIWDEESLQCKDLPETVKRRFSTIIPLGCYQFYRTTPRKTLVRVGVAILPPNHRG